MKPVIKEEICKLLAILTGDPEPIFKFGTVGGNGANRVL
jgi:hypothetical protein